MNGRRFRFVEVTRELVGGTQSEGPFDGFAGNLDFCMYGYFYPLEKDDYARMPMADRHVPLFQLVYHGIILSNPFTGTLNYPVKARGSSSTTGRRLAHLRGWKPPRWIGCASLPPDAVTALRATPRGIVRGPTLRNSNGRRLMSFWQR